MTNQKKFLSVVAIFLILIPFSTSDKNDNIEPVVLDDSTIGYYQSTTCKISLLEFYQSNYSSNIEIYINNNNYADINCFGKITGLDKNANVFFVSIGTNSVITLIIQTLLWTLLLLFIPKTKNTWKVNRFGALLIPYLFIFQYVSENRFYQRENILFDGNISFNNLYLISILIFLSTASWMVFDVLRGRLENLINYIPFVFLFIFTFNGANINFYIFIFSTLGLSKVASEKKVTFVNVVYLLFSIFWLINIEENDYFFDGDKIRGFTNSSYNFQSQLFWIVIFFLFIKGAQLTVSVGLKNFSKLLFLKNLIITSTLITILGIFGSFFPLINFFNFYIFGQNKRGIKSFESVDGNTWRGFSSSAESLGEFYGFIILFFIIAYFSVEKSELKPYSYLIFFPIYGLYRSNNFAAFLSLLILIFIFINFKMKIIKFNKKYFFTFILFVVVLASIFINFSNYDFYSSNLIYEATRHQNFYGEVAQLNNKLKSTSKSHYLVLEAIEKDDVGTILLDKENNDTASSSFKLLLNIFTQSFNIPLIPNIVALISLVAFFINRSEMWGIFIAKYSPDTYEAIFGFGPMQLNKYLYEQKVRLDVPKNLQSSLFLPHSSIADTLIFFGILGLFIALCLIIYVLFKSNKNHIMFLPTIFLILNISKSDSLLYINSFILTLFCLLILDRDKNGANN